MLLRFTKMHGLGNDFIVIPHFDFPDSTWERLALELCDRHRGIGADGLIILSPSTAADVGMKIFNSDGSEAAMCGNGLRCLAHYARARGAVSTDAFAVETRAGLRLPEIVKLDGGSAVVRVDMGAPSFLRGDIPMTGPPDEPARDVIVEIDGASFTATCVSVGNPHCVIFTDGVDAIDLHRLGPLIERHRLFPGRTNVEFVEVKSPGELLVKVWERGAGETLACGTGACASLAAAAFTGRSARQGSVRLPGGALHIEWRDDGRMVMTGPSAVAFEGEVAIET